MLEQKKISPIIQFFRDVKKAILTVVLSPIRLFRWVCFTVGFLVLVTLFLFGAYLAGIYRSLPDVQKVDFVDFKKTAQRSVVARLENKSQSPNWTPIKEMSRELIYSIMVGEDSSFFEHEGFNFGAMVDAFAENIKLRKYALGASTISQQVVKNVFLTRNKTITRKLKEVILTRQIEERFSKNQILEIYLNIAEFGPDLYGVAAASRRFFDKTPGQIDAAEGAFLAVLLPSPKKSYYSMFVNKKISKAKRRKINRILKDLLTFEIITQEQFIAMKERAYFEEPKN